MTSVQLRGILTLTLTVRLLDNADYKKTLLLDLVRTLSFGYCSYLLFMLVESSTESWLPRNMVLLIMLVFPNVKDSAVFLKLVRLSLVLCHAHPSITALAYVFTGLDFHKNF